MAPIRETHPHPIWDLGDYIGRFLEKAGVDRGLSVFFDLMPDVDLDEIRRVGREIWGTDFQNMGAVTGALNHAATQLPLIRDVVAESWSGEAFERFKNKLIFEQDLFEKARGISQNVGRALVEFADAANANLVDGLSMLIGVVGTIVGAAVGLIGGPAGAAAGAVAGALVGLAVGMVFSFIGVLLPKMLQAFQALDELADQLPPDYKE
jgi:ABC-type multidrug transport system fused ATPase/permease subunit